MGDDFNPFLISGYSGPDFFCDREDETARLNRYIRNKNHVTLFAMRRLGKTGLIQHVFDAYKSRKTVNCLYVDILGTRNLREFCNQLATAIYNHFPENRGTGKRILDFVKALRPVISYDELSGQPEVSFEAGETRRPEKTIQQLFEFLDKQQKRIVIAIDEFQQIIEYPEKNTEALLRTYMQSLKYTSFIFCGSNQKIMHEIFNSAKRPFFASCTGMHLDYIDEAKYADFIVRTFKSYKRAVDAESVAFILEWTLTHTYYTQYLCNHIFTTNARRINLDFVRSAAVEVLKINEPTYYQYRNLLTPQQWELLRAVASETRLYKAHSSQFIRKYGLGTSSMVTRGLQALIEKEMVYHNTSVEKPYYEVYDKFLMRWLQ